MIRFSLFSLCVLALPSGTRGANVTRGADAPRLAAPLPALAQVPEPQPKMTPGGVFQAAKDAIKADNWRGFLNHTTKESQAALAGGLLVIGGVIMEQKDLPQPEFNGKAIKKVLTQYGQTEEMLRRHFLLAKELDGNNQALAQTLVKIGKTLRNQQGFSVDFLKALKSSLGPLEGMLKEVLDKADVQNVQIEGATARATMTVGPGAQKSNIFFREEDGVWKIDVVRMLAEQAK